MRNKGGDEEKVEPKENDKWMDNNDTTDPNHDGLPSQSRLENLSQRAKHFASNKYNVVIALLCVLLFIFFIIVIALAVQLGSYQCPQPNECLTPECLSASSVIAARSDISVDPCSDFWSYSCRGWLDRNALPENKGSLSVRDKRQGNVYGHIRHLIDLIPHDVHSASAQGKVRTFYTACMKQDTNDLWAHEKSMQLIREIGDWAVGDVPPSGKWDSGDILKRLHVSYGIPAFFRIVVEPDDTVPTRNIIKLVPDGLGLPSRRLYFESLNDPYIQAYKEYMRNTMRELGKTFSEAKKFAEDIFHYEKRLAEIMPEISTLRNTSGNYKIITVAELSRLSISILWTDLLQSYFPEIVQSSTEVAVLSELYFSDLSRLISTTDSRVLNDYFMWISVHTFIPHLSPKFNLVANQLKQTFEGVKDLNLPYEEKWEFCTELTNQHFGHVLSSMYMERFFPKQSFEEALHSVQKMIGALSIEIRSLPWFDDGYSFTSAEEKVRTLVPLVGYPSFINNKTAVDEYYKEMRVQADHFHNIKNFVNFHHKMQSQMLKNHAVNDYSWTTSPLDVESDYKYAGNHLVVPAGMLGLPLFDFGAPVSVKYGVLGGHVSNVLSRMFDDKGISYEAYGVLKPWMSNRSSEVYQEKQNCLKTRIANYSLHGVTVEPNLTVGSFMADIGGVKIAHEAYKRHVGVSEKEEMLPGVAANNDQLFFISYAQSLCESVRPEKLTALRSATNSLPAELRVLGTLQQLPEFASAFSCPEGSIMNPYDQCRVW